MKSIYRVMIVLGFILALPSLHTFSQVAINANGSPPDPSAMLDVSSTNRGMLIPRMTTAARNLIPSPATGLLIYNITTNRFDYYSGSFWHQVEATFISSTAGSNSPGGGVSISVSPGAVPDNSAMLDISNASRGVLIPRISTASRDQISSPATGLLIYNTETNLIDYYNGTQWITLCSVTTGVAGAGGTQAALGVADKTDNSAPHHSAMLDVSATNKGVLIPRLTTVQRDLVLPALGLVIYNSTANNIEFYNGSGWYQLTTTLACAASCGSPLLDTRDGKSYNTVQIGSQCWMAQSLNTGTMIPGAYNMSDNGTIEKYCYEDLTNNCDVYGGLYQWNEMMAYSTTPGLAGICPPAPGWHLPTLAELTTLTNFLQYTSASGGKMKSTGTIEDSTGLWFSPNEGATNSSGFTSLPAGFSYPGSNTNRGIAGYLWSSTPNDVSSSHNLILFYHEANASVGFAYYNWLGFSVRCMKNETTSKPVVTPVNHQVTRFAGTVSFEVTANTSWSVEESESWLTVSLAGGSNNGTFTATYDLNSSYTPRTGQITITAAGGAPVVTATVTQEALPPLAWSCGDTLADSRDNQEYTTVQIGTQCWMAENLNFGTMIPNYIGMANNNIPEKYCYDDNTVNCDVYGGLYQWSEVMQYVVTPGVQGICPAGWHLPTDSAWTTLTDFLGGENLAADKMKSTGTVGAGTGLWYINNYATNSSGFSAIPGGYRYFFGGTYNVGWEGYWWSSSESMAGNAWYRRIDNTVIHDNVDINHGLSVRCVREVPPPVWNCGDSLLDSRDNQKYGTVQIGNQCWMAENLNTGTWLSAGYSGQTNNQVIEKFCGYNNPASCDIYGGLYTWNEMMGYSTTPGVQGICPANWHVPTNAEWTTQSDSLGGTVIAGGKMKETGTSHWYAPNAGATNESGFTALPGGYYSSYWGSFLDEGYSAYFWTSTESSSTDSWLRYLGYYTAEVYGFSEPKYLNYSVRCVKDNN